MNYYERIQVAIDYIEDHLEEHIEIGELAKASYMSISGFQCMFFATTGFSAKEYLRKRRMCEAGKMIIQGDRRIIDIAMKYDYKSVDAFSRGFKKITGSLPRMYRNIQKPYQFNKIDLMDKYFEVQDKEMMEKYPDIKVLKELPDMKCLCFHFYGKQPENGAFEKMTKWCKANQIHLDEGYRIYGYDNPSPKDKQSEYGYDVCVQLPVWKEYEEAKTKQIKGGRYVVISLTRKQGEDLGTQIMLAWQRFRNWLKGSRYQYGTGQWLEEHIGFNMQYEHIGGIDLYMPIELKESH